MKQLQKENLMRYVVVGGVILVAIALYIQETSPCNNPQQRRQNTWSLTLDQDVQLIFNYPCQAVVSNASEKTYRYRIFEESEGIFSGLTEKTIRMETVSPGSRSQPFYCDYNKFELLDSSNNRISVLKLNNTLNTLRYP